MLARKKSRKCLSLVVRLFEETENVVVRRRLPAMRVLTLGGRCAAAVVAAIGLSASASAQVQGVSQSSVGPAAATTAPQRGASTGQAVPRFVSFKSDKVRMRAGPGTDHAIQWVYNRAGLPVEVIAESDVWRRVRDSEGTTGWVLGSLLSSRRTALVEPWSLKPGAPPVTVPLKADDSASAADVAQVEAGVIASVRSCDGRWCFVTILDFRGYIEQRRLWGVYKDETIK